MAGRPLLLLLLMSLLVVWAKAGSRRRGQLTPPDPTPPENAPPLTAPDHNTEGVHSNMTEVLQELESLLLSLPPVPPPRQLTKRQQLQQKTLSQATIACPHSNPYLCPSVCPTYCPNVRPNIPCPVTPTARPCPVCPTAPTCRPCPPAPPCPDCGCPPGPVGPPGPPGPPCVGPPGLPGSPGSGLPGLPGPPGVCDSQCPTYPIRPPQRPVVCPNNDLMNQILILLQGHHGCSHACPQQRPDVCSWDSDHLWALFYQVKSRIEIIGQLDTRIDLLVAAVFRMRLAVQRAYDMVGDVGAPGDEGDSGEKGEKGPTGEPGKCPEMTCLVGPAGPPGLAGETGEPGAKGECCYGTRGPRGHKGRAGNGTPGQSGVAGHKGQKGDPGRVLWSSYDSAGISPW